MLRRPVRDLPVGNALSNLEGFVRILAGNLPPVGEEVRREENAALRERAPMFLRSSNTHQPVTTSARECGSGR